MKQIIVSLHWLSVEQKQRVNEALAKITGATKLPDSKIGDGWLFATPALDGMMITSDWLLSYGEPTHTAQEVLEMAGMATERKVRKDFDPKRAYSVDVSNCTEDEKKKVQQAFFDIGFLWRLKGKEYLHLGRFTCEQTAHEAWLKRKLELARELAAIQIDTRVAKALISKYENYNNPSE